MVGPAAGGDGGLLRARRPGSSCECRGLGPRSLRARTKRAVKVAIPERWQRSSGPAVHREQSLDGPIDPGDGGGNLVAPLLRRQPSSSAPAWRKTSAATSSPKTTPGCFKIVAVPMTSPGTTAWR